MDILRLPDQGAQGGEAEVVVWLKQIGEPVTAGEPLLEVQSDKANVEVETTVSGILAQVLAEEGQLIQSGAPLAVITQPGEVLDASLVQQALAGSKVDTN